MQRIQAKLSPKIPDTLENSWLKSQAACLGALVLAGCGAGTSTETVPPAQVFPVFEAKHDAETQETSFQAHFHDSRAGGPVLELAPPARVLLDGTPLSLVSGGTRYLFPVSYVADLKLAPDRLSGSFKFTYIDATGAEYTNEISLPTLSPRNASLPPLRLSGGESGPRELPNSYEFAWQPVDLAQGDELTILVENGSEVLAFDVGDGEARQGKLNVPLTRFHGFEPGSAEVRFRRRQLRVAKNAPAVGGHLQSEFISKKYPISVRN